MDGWMGDDEMRIFRRSNRKKKVFLSEHKAPCYDTVQD